MGILDGNVISFIEDLRVLVDESYLIYSHTRKKGPNDSLIFFSLGYANEIPLPNVGYHLYNCQSLTISLVPQEVNRRHSVFSLPGRMTRSMARTETAPNPPPPQPQPSYPHEAGGLLWHSASTDEWARQAQLAGPPAPAPARSHTLHNARLRVEDSAPSLSSSAS
jgi:hypothetical protein